MKIIYERFCEGLKVWPVLRGVCIFALTVSLIEVLALATISQFTGVVSTTQNFNFVFYHRHLPLGISRLWDIISLPLFIYLSYMNESSREDQYFAHNGQDDHYGERIIDLRQMSLCGAMLGSSMFGIVYLVPAFIVTYVLICFVALLLVCAEGFSNLLRKKPAVSR